MGIEKLIARYTERPGENYSFTTKALTARIKAESMIKLETIAHHFNVKKTPLGGEILENAIEDIFDRIFDDLDEGLRASFAEEMSRFQDSLDHEDES